MAHIVKCAVCGETFDRDIIRTTRYNARRYTHYDCFPTGELVEVEFAQDEKDRRELCNYIVEKHGLKATGPVINKEIKQFHDEAGYTYSGMLKALKYWYEIKNMFDPKYKDTVNIIGRVYSQAKEYYYNLYLAQQMNLNKNIKDYTGEEKVVTIPQPERREKSHRRLFDLGED